MLVRFTIAHELNIDGCKAWTSTMSEDAVGAIRIFDFDPGKLTQVHVQQNCAESFSYNLVLKAERSEMGVIKVSGGSLNCTYKAGENLKRTKTKIEEMLGGRSVEGRGPAVTCAQLLEVVGLLT